MIYVFPLANGTDMGMHKSECINQFSLHALEVESWKFCLLCFPRIQASHCFNLLGIVGKPEAPFFFKKQGIS